MKKRILIIILILAIFLAQFLAIPSSADGKYERCYITVDLNGDQYDSEVFKNPAGKIMVSIGLLTSWTGMKQTTNSSQYIFYYKAQDGRTLFRKEIHIDKSGKKGSAVCYTSKDHYKTLYSASFSDSYAYLDRLYLPLEEFLPFLEAKIEITEDGILHVYPNPISIFSAISYGPCGNIDWLTFNSSEDVCANLFVGTFGYVMNSIFDTRFDRLDFLLQSGAIKDYSSLFKALLVDNKTYLSAFDKEETPFDIALGEVSDSLGDFKAQTGSGKDYYDALKYLVKSDVHKEFQPFKTGVDGLDDFVGDSSKFISGVYKTFCFARAYINQVDDHREMLNAVYGGSRYNKNDAACKAANEVSALYGRDTAGIIVSATTSALRDYMTKTISGAITKSWTPYTIALTAVKAVIPGAFEEFDNAAMLFFYDDIVADAKNVYNSYLAGMNFDTESLKNLRLSLIMTLEASKHAYETYYGENPSMSESVADKLKTINAWLEKLYLAADSVEFSSTDYYKSQKSALSKTGKQLKVTTYSTPADTDDDVITDDSTEDNSNNDILHGDLVDFGKCGDNVEWQLDDKGTLTVSGRGDMYDYEEEVAPWSPYNKSIYKIIISPGVTSIGTMSFMDCYNLSSIDIPNTVTSIPSLAFWGCGIEGNGITSLVIPEGVTSIEDRAFHCGKLSTVYLPKSLTFIEATAFEGTGMHKVYYAGSEEDWEEIEIWWEDIYTDDEGNLLMCTTLYYAEKIFNHKYSPTDETPTEDDVTDNEDNTTGSTNDPNNVSTSNKVIVPNVVGMEQLEAIYMLMDLGLQFQVYWLSGNDVLVGHTYYIVDQSTEPGTEVPLGSLIRLQISRRY